MFKRKSSRGFTLIELSLSLVFIGILSIAIVLIISNTVASYRRGQTLNSIATMGMDLVDDFRSAVQNSSASTASSDCMIFYGPGAVREQCINDNASNFTRVTKYASVRLSDTEVINNVPVYGAFCTGSYSYIWNSGYFENSEINAEGQDRQVMGTASAVLKYRNLNNNVVTVQKSLRTIDGDRPFRLLKVRDDSRAVCVSVVRKYNGRDYENNYKAPSNDALSNVFDISEGYGVVVEEPVDLILADNDNNLVLYDLNIAKPAESGTRTNAFYAASFILGTMGGGINIKATGNNCTPPMEYETQDFDYCAINKFSFAVQANGE